MAPFLRQTKEKATMLAPALLIYRRFSQPECGWKNLKILKKVQILLETPLCYGVASQVPAAQIAIAVFHKWW
jgi:hypothetical protein